MSTATATMTRTEARKAARLLLKACGVREAIEVLAEEANRG